MSVAKEKRGGRSRPFGLDHIQFCYHGVKSSELSSEASVWLAGRSGKRWSPWEIAVRRVLSSDGTVSCYEVSTGGTKTHFTVELLFLVFLPLPADLNRVCWRKAAVNELFWVREFMKTVFYSKACYVVSRLGSAKQSHHLEPATRFDWSCITASVMFWRAGTTFRLVANVHCTSWNHLFKAEGPTKQQFSMMLQENILLQAVNTELNMQW